MILQFLQIFLTDARTFMIALQKSSRPHAKGAYYIRFVARMRPRPASGCNSPQRGTPERPNDLRFDFFISGSYWCDTRCDCSCAMKSITTITMISSDVPPK